MNKIKNNINCKKNKQLCDIEFIVQDSVELLEFLLNKMSNKSRNYVKSVLTHKRVKVNGSVITQYNHVLHPGQKISISRAKKEFHQQEELLDIIYEDKYIVVINKPAGLLTVATEQEKELTAYALLTDYVRVKNYKNRIFIVHRLDKDTSGIIVFAKNEETKLALQDNWSELVSLRGYVALVEGTLKEKSGRIQSWLNQTKTLLMYSSYTPGDGLEAITNYKVIKQGAEYSLLDIRLETGRKNQIRVHMKDIGHNVVGDKKYGAKANPLKRLALHANKLEFRHPVFNEIMSFETQTPNGFLSLLGQSKK